MAPMEPAKRTQRKNRIQWETTADGRKVFREYCIGKDYDVPDEHISDLDQAIKRALELGYYRDAKELAQFRQGGQSA